MSSDATCNFPMTLEEGKFIRDCLLEVKHTFYIGNGKHFSVAKKEMLDNLIDGLESFNDNHIDARWEE